MMSGLRVASKCQPLKLKDLLYTPGEPIPFVYFLAADLLDCHCAEGRPHGGVVTIGREGMVGVETRAGGR